MRPTPTILALATLWAALSGWLIFGPDSYSGVADHATPERQQTDVEVTQAGMN